MECPFCRPPKEQLLYEDSLIRILLDAYPASRGHLLVVPRRHVERWEDLRDDEKLALIRGMELAMEVLRETLKPDAFNVGMNLGKEAGQTVPHLHLHVIPRWRGDSKNPRGGVRKAVLDLEDENLSLKERWVRNRLKPEEVSRLREAFNRILGSG
ncbi:Diadenosine tetraphosphate (Ap4A) hydrolase and other HIT family hydrolase [Thermococcus nautili]|uniref:HIT family protein n=1 Tax=Thermococcus nautili TaxID=195522 RepID=UPI002557562C|nr:HIT family protein [Thermococcus nautili]CAI1492228.1 Diadenosine tetraphosphate (Ap4A) hydrolase and other HIT family hydrolase [Thermococcus nautili]